MLRELEMTQQMLLIHVSVSEMITHCVQALATERSRLPAPDYGTERR